MSAEIQPLAAAHASLPGAALPGIRPSSRLTLCRLVISPHENDFTVRRYGTGKGIVTGRLGVETVRLLQSGLTVEEVARRLAGGNGSAGEGIDLTRILSALWKAEMIRAVDGVAATAERRPGLREWWRYEG